ncbi:propionate catabolism operon transcriptional regulator [Bacillus pakistanensis]|uniref:Propionate catabolism operon transcriptional regulator n=1 Tax=Rossellomorea pakistanensis TaxID=992288 RepID=A0ABS2ND01_9BACI|nr:sigma 54-interacting transcriptional regulator [Bacillus pakistanensis]MBM7585720.1 propionate catabolism operon transcriptional regulator [Bacillus pakistanensis]
MKKIIKNGLLDEVRLLNQRIVVISYHFLTQLVKEAIKEIETLIPIDIMEVELGKSKEIARKLDEDENVAAIVAPRGHASFISELNQTPLVVIDVTDNDFLIALNKAAKESNEVVIMRYGKIFKEFQLYDHLFHLTIHHDRYFSTIEAKEKVHKWIQKGIKNIIGTTVVYNEAKKEGAHAVYLYSIQTIKEQLKQAVEIVRSREQDQAKLKWINAVISSTNHAVISTNHKGEITLTNEQASNLLKLSSSFIQGQMVKEIFKEVNVEPVLKNGQSLENVIIHFQQQHLIANVTPIQVEKRIIGSVFLFQEISKVSDAENKIRKELTKKGLVAKNNFSAIIHQSTKMKRIIKKAKIYAKTNLSILIQGETGTGKELFAQSIHNESERRDQPFVAINCSALPDQLLESELFGYVEGAFTGAKKGGKKGLFELAHGGTIFLDEIGEISESLQARLLRVLQEKEIMRVGGESVIPIDVRIVAATNRELKKMVDTREFREDLYYRLNILDLTLPALRERKEDIPLLIKYFIKKKGLPIKENLLLDTRIVSQLMNIKWSGNIRELENLLERMMVIYEHTSDRKMVEEIIEEWKVKQNYGNESTSRPRLEFQLKKAEKETILKVLNEVGGNKEIAAERLGISRSTLWRKLKQ